MGLFSLRFFFRFLMNFPKILRFEEMEAANEKGETGSVNLYIIASNVILDMQDR